MTGCAMTAFAEGHAFFVRYYDQMPHSFGYKAFAGNAAVKRGGAVGENKRLMSVCLFSCPVVRQRRMSSYRRVHFDECYSEEFPPGEREGRRFDGGTRSGRFLSNCSAPGQDK